MKAAQAQIKQAEAGERESQFRRLPQLSARSQWTRSDHPVFVFGSLMEQGRFGPQNFAVGSLNHPGELTNIKSALDLGVPLFTRFELTSQTRLSRLARDQAGRGFEATAQAVRLEAALLYSQLLLDQELLKSLDDRIAASGQEVADARKLKERGLVFGSDYYAAEAIYGGLRTWRIQVEADRAATLAQLQILCARADWQPADVLTGKAPAVPALDALQALARQKRPDLLAADSQISISRVARQQAGRALWPDLQAYASLETNTRDFRASPSNHTMGVAARVPFGDPTYGARRSRFASSEEFARETRSDLEDRVRADVAQAYEAFRGALAALPMAKETFDHAAKSLDLFRPLYRSGRQSILEVLRAEEALAKTHAAYFESLFAVHARFLMLQAAAGLLDDQTIESAAQLMQAQP